jgi:hypothetical protein
LIKLTLKRFRSLSRRTQELGARTLDVLHVACACELAADCFLSFDQRQLVLAERAGLRVRRPDVEG